MVNNLEDAIRTGFSYLERREYDRAVAHFESIRHHNPLVYYGLATAYFRKHESSFTSSQIDKIISLYRQSLELDSNFPDTHLMLGHAYEVKARILRSDYQREPTEEKRSILAATLLDAERHLTIASKINSNYGTLVGDHLATIKRLKDEAGVTFH